MTARAVLALVAVLLGLPAPWPAAAEEEEAVVHVTVRQFAYAPAAITIRKGVPVVLELVSADRTHGFNLPGLHVQAEVRPGTPTRVRILAPEAGRYPFHCDVFCGEGHEEMEGVLIVTD